MAKYVWLVFTNATPGDDEEFNRWYDEVHIPDLLKIPAVVRATRSQLTDPQMQRAGDELIVTDAAAIDAKYRYLAQYFLETDDVTDFLNEVKRRANTPDMIISPTLGDVYTVMYADRS